MSNSNSEICRFLENRIIPIITTERGGIYFDKDVLSRTKLFTSSVLLISDNRFTDFSSLISRQIVFHPDFNEQIITIFSDDRKYIDDYSLEELKKFKAVIIVDAKTKNKNYADSLLTQYQKSGGTVFKLKGKWIDYESVQRRAGSVFSDTPAWIYSSDEEKQLSSFFTSITVKENIGRITTKKYTPEDLIFEVMSIQDNTVFQLSDSFYPGWKATIDGKEASLYMADSLVKGIVIPNKGTHEIRMYYQPDSFRLGALISSLTLLTLLGLGIFLKMKKIVK